MSFTRDERMEIEIEAQMHDAWLERNFVECPECYGDGGCDLCDGSGYVHRSEM